MVKAIYFVDPPDEGDGPPNSAAPTIRAWNAQSHTFEETSWPAELTDIRTRYIHDGFAVFDMPAKRVGPRGRGGDPRNERPRDERGPGPRGAIRMPLPPIATGDDQSIVIPVMRITPGHAITEDPRAAPEVKLLGFTIIRFDLASLTKDVLPALVRKHLYTDDGQTDFSIAVVSRNDPQRVLFESAPGAAAIAADHPDIAQTLMRPSLGQFVFMAREGRRGPFAPPPPPQPPSNTAVDTNIVVIEAKRDDALTVRRTEFSGDGDWRLLVKHRSGSLEAAVAAARTRNFVLSSGILALLATAIGLIVVSARRADRLARQQLEFVAAVSHELRTPVSVIGAAAVNLADGLVEDPTRVKQYGSTIHTEARRLGETVERVLQLAGIAAGRAAAAHNALAVPTLIEEAVEATRAEREAAGVTIEVDIADELRHSPADPDGVQRVVGDAAALRSAIQNLISNAIKYGGDARWVRVSAKPLSHKVTRIAVEDRGFGIEAEDRKHIFEPFYRGREALSRQIHGSGLGLHLVRRIVESHGGTITVDTDAGRGSTFTIDLPGVHEVVRLKPHAYRARPVG
jgi:signal transduction histidine kinase